MDGEPMSGADAVDQCKHTDGAVVVIEDDVPCDASEATCSALRQEGIQILMRGPVGDFNLFRRPIVASKAPPTKPEPQMPLIRCQAACEGNVAGR